MGFRRPTIKREHATRLLDAVGANVGLLRLRGALPTGGWLTVVCYHRVDNPAPDSPYDGETVDATPAQFEEQVAFLAEHFNIVGVDGLCAAARGKPLPKNPAVITFDDGYKACFTQALPILKAHNAKGIFFIPTDYHRDRRLFWWDAISLLLRQTKQTQLVVNYPRPFRLDLSKGPQKAISQCLVVAKYHYPMDVVRFVDELAEAAGIPWSLADQRPHVDRLVATWDEIKALQSASMDIESHTCSHRVMQTVPPHEWTHEFLSSRLQLEEALGTPVRAIAYPVGRSLTPSLYEAVADAGYEVGFTNGSSPLPLWQNPRGQDFLAVGRFAMYQELSREFFQSMMALPQLAFRKPIVDKRAALSAIDWLPRKPRHAPR